MQLVWLVFVAWFSTPSAAATPSSGELLRDLERLRVVGSVLYVAAHPDDENTRLIAWLVGDRGLRTAYLSMTRGGGGQNLIGSEQAELLGVVRTGELLGARRIDGGEQLFTRMRDFGYSKSPEETLALWGHDEALADVVRAIRTFRPNVVVTRFGSEGRGHGHHTASARLAAEAFERAADPAYVTEGLEPWQAQRLLHNQSTWRLPEGSEVPAEWLRVNVGTFDPRTGRAFGEIAAHSRSQHKSQGFGSAPQPGPVMEYFSPVAGSAHPLPFGGLELDWSRFEGTGKLDRTLRAAIARFDPAAPHEILPRLAKAHALLQQVGDPHWRTLKTAELEAVMRACAGLWLTARTEVPAAPRAVPVPVTVEALTRAPVPASITAITWPDGTSTPGASLLPHEPASFEATFTTPDAATRPPWLELPPEPTRYVVEDPALRNVPDSPGVLARVSLELQGVAMEVSVPVTHAVTDPVQGQVVRPFEVHPRVTATFPSRHLLVPFGREVLTEVTVRHLPDDPEVAVDASVLLQVTDGFESIPPGVKLTFAPGELERTVPVRIRATRNQAGNPPDSGMLTTLTWSHGEESGHLAPSRHVIDHPHLPQRTVFGPATVALSPVALDRGGVTRVGYLQGSGDAVPEVLRGLGYDVVDLDLDTLTDTDLRRLPAIVLGIRAYNTLPDLPAHHDQLMNYVSRGGTLVVQYNTSRRWSTLSSAIGPAPFEVGRGRVTDETAAVTLLEPKHRALTRPNRLTEADFDGWVQERGLYFVETWDPSYTPLLELADPGEEPQQGSLIVARHGRGHFVYTGLSFFRQLPAGVPGATRLFANLLALGQR